MFYFVLLTCVVYVFQTMQMPGVHAHINALFFMTPGVCVDVCMVCGWCVRGCMYDMWCVRGCMHGM